MPVPTIRVTIADDHPIVRDGLRLTLENHRQIRIVGVAASFREVFEQLALHATDVLVLDIGGMHGSPLTAIARLRREYPNVAIVVFSSTISLAPELLKAGVRGYVVKEELANQLLGAIEAAYRGEQFLSPLVAAYVERTTAFQHDWKLTPKELLVLKLLAQELSTSEIAAQLGIDPRSVQNYITTLYRKTAVDGRTQLVAWYRRLHGVTTV